MKNFWKNLKSGMLFSGVFSFVLGLVLMIIPDILTGALSLILAGGLTLFGLLEIVFVFVRPNGLLSVGRMIPGILCLTIGLVFFFRPETFLSIIWILMGIAVLIDSVYKLQYAFELKAKDGKNWWMNLLSALIALIFAVVLIVAPFEAARSMTVLAGALLCANGLFDLATVVMMSISKGRESAVAPVYITNVEEREVHLEKK